MSDELTIAAKDFALPALEEVLGINKHTYGQLVEARHPGAGDCLMMTMKIGAAIIKLRSALGLPLNERSNP